MTFRHVLAFLSRTSHTYCDISWNRWHRSWQHPIFGSWTQVDFFRCAIFAQEWTDMEKLAPQRYVLRCRSVEAMEIMASQPNPPGHVPCPEIAGIMIRAYYPWFPLTRPEIKPLFLGEGTFGGVGWLAINKQTKSNRPSKVTIYFNGITLCRAFSFGGFTVTSKTRIGQRFSKRLVLYFAV